MQPRMNAPVASDQASVTALFRRDRQHQLVISGLDPALATQLADVQVRGWTSMIADVAEPEYLAVLVDGAPIAGVVLGGAGRGRIVWIGVHPEHRRRGHARRLLEELCNRADSEEKVLDLQVERTNLGALALYVEAGFRQAGTEQTTDLYLVREPRRSAA